MNIQQAIDDFIKDGGPAVVTKQDGQPGVLFTSEGAEFVPWDDLGYNSQIGFYQVSQFPDVHNETGVNFSPARFTVQDGTKDGYTMWCILPDDVTDGFRIGQWGDVCRLYHCLKELIETRQAEEIDELDPRLGTKWVSGPEADRYAAEQLDITITPRAIQYACERGEIRLAENDGGGWAMPLRSFRNWLGNRPKPGPKVNK